MKNIRQWALLVVAICLAFGAIVQSVATAGNASARSNLTLIAPAAIGGGWDGFARQAQQSLRQEGIVNNVSVVNIPGAGGTIGLSQFAQMTGNDNTMMITGGVMVGAIELRHSQTTLNDVTLLARVADDYAALVVPADSPFQTLGDVVNYWKENPTGLSISGGSLGSIDHFLSASVAMEIGVDPAHVNYIAYSGGGEALNSLLSHTTDIGMSGYNEVADQVEAGTLRALAISSPERLEGIDVPTFKEQGIDVQMANWRGFVGAPGISEETKAELVEIITELRNSKDWQAAVKRNNWTDAFMTGPELDQFVAEESETVRTLVEKLGL